ncbi:MAG: NAD(P)/FAD-dependent oxidoreductase [Spirochaetes bacterium]|nr:NAD(P)/FAD-dependent oxidoreductase [Spirochaetota bacterium]
MKKVAVIGGGPAGMTAAIFAARSNCRVTLFEKQKKLGSKIYVTGNGTCNITNLNCSSGHYNSADTTFPGIVLNEFSLKDTISFFESIGLTLAEKRDGRMYPASFQAVSVADVLEEELNRLNVDVRLHRRVDSVFYNKNGIKLVTAGKEEDTFDSVIVSAGGPASPDLGGSGRGADLALKLSHKVLPYFPSILPINIIEKQLHRLEGIKWDCALSVFVNGIFFKKSEGELLFAKFGISGPAAIDISRYVNDAVLKKSDVNIFIDFFPGIDHKLLLNKIRISSAGGKRTVEQTLNSILKKRIPRYFLNEIQIEPEKIFSEISSEDVERLVSRLKNEKITPGEPRDYKDAATAAGGVDVRFINPHTMESTLKKNIYFAGEMIDVDGDCGGYNLQFCWSSGAIAGRSQKG